MQGGFIPYKLGGIMQLTTFDNRCCAEKPQ